MPCQAEMDRHDLLQHIYGMMLGGKLVFAPIGDNPQRILDVGTGTGLWAIDVAEYVKPLIRRVRPTQADI